MRLKNWKPLFWDTVQHFLHPTHTVLHHHIREGRVKEASRLNTSQTNAVWGLQPHSSATGELLHRQSCHLVYTHQRGRAPAVLHLLRWLPSSNCLTGGGKEPMRKFFCLTTSCNSVTWPETGCKVHKLSWRSHKPDRNRIILWSGYKKLGNPGRRAADCSIFSQYPHCSALDITVSSHHLPQILLFMSCFKLIQLYALFNSCCLAPSPW